MHRTKHSTERAALTRQSSVDYELRLRHENVERKGRYYGCVDDIAQRTVRVNTNALGQPNTKNCIEMKRHILTQNGLIAQATHPPGSMLMKSNRPLQHAHNTYYTPNYKWYSIFRIMMPSLLASRNTQPKPHRVSHRCKEPNYAVLRLCYVSAAVLLLLFMRCKRARAQA